MAYGQRPPSSMLVHGVPSRGSEIEHGVAEMRDRTMGRVGKLVTANGRKRRRDNVIVSRCPARRRSGDGD